MSYITNTTPFNNIEIITTTRQGGFSKAPFNSFNMSYNVGDNPEDVLKNRAQLYEEIHIDPKNVIVPKQLDTDNIFKIDDIIDGREGDAFYTYNKEIALSVIHSNCVPIFIYAKDKNIIGSIHASIKGSMLEITKKFISVLIKKESCDPKNIYAFFGPGVAFSHIIVDEKIIQKAENIGYLNCCKKSSGVLHIDINLMNYLQLVKMGVDQEHIFLSKYDTYENANLFFSSMRNKETGRMLSLIRFKD